MTQPPDEYRNEPIPRQLGALSASLARVCSTARRTARADAVPPLLRECMVFIEWTAPRVDADVGGELAEMQVMLGLWLESWPEAKASVPQRTLLSYQAKTWSDRVLDHSGLRNG